MNNTTQTLPTSVILRGGTLTGTAGTYPGGYGHYAATLANTIISHVGDVTSTIDAPGGVNLYLDRTVTFNVANGASATDLLVSAIIKPLGAATAGVTKTGPGTLTLTGASTYTGGTTVSQGTLSLSGGQNRLPGGVTDIITVGAGATLDAGDGNAQSAHNLTLNGGTLSSSGGGNWYISDISVSGGANTSTISATNVYLYGYSGSINFSVGSGATSGVDLDVTGTFQTGTGRPLIKSGPGVMRLSAGNS